MRRQVIWSLGLLLALVLAGGCAGGTEPAARGQETAPAETGEQKTLKILSCAYHPLIASAAERYGTQHPEFSVEYESILGDSLGNDQLGQAAEQAYERLCSGEQIDVLVVDDLPVERLIREGRLEDLTETLESVLKDETYYREVISGYRTEKGLFAAVTEFSPIVACLRQGVPEEVLTLDGLYGYLQEQPDSTGFVPYQQKNQLKKMLYRMYGGELLSAGEPDRDALAVYLRTWKLLQDRAAAAEGPKLDKMAGTIDELACMAETGSGDLCFLKEVGTMSSVTARRTEGILTVPSGKNLAQTVVGVSARSEQKEQALDFVRCLFEQLLPQQEGMTVYKNRPALEASAAMQQEKQGDHFTVGRETFVRYSLREEDIDWLMDCYGKCTQPAPGLQDGFYEVLTQNSEDWLAGEQELEAALDRITAAAGALREEK